MPSLALEENLGRKILDELRSRHGFRSSAYRAQPVDARPSLFVDVQFFVISMGNRWQFQYLRSPSYAANCRLLA